MKTAAYDHDIWTTRAMECGWMAAFVAGAVLAIFSLSSALPVETLALALPLFASIWLKIWTGLSLGGWVMKWLNTDDSWMTCWGASIVEWSWMAAFAAGTLIAILSPAPDIPVLSVVLAAPWLLSMVCRVVFRHSIGDWVMVWVAGETCMQAQWESNRVKMKADAALGMAAMEPFHKEGDRLTGPDIDDDTACNLAETPTVSEELH